MLVIQMNANTVFKKNTLLLTMGTFLNKGIQFLVIPLYSKWLSSSDYGRFDLLCTYISFLVPMVSLAVYEAVFRLSVSEPDQNEIIGNVTAGFLINIINFSVFILFSLCCLNKLEKRLYIGFALYLFAELLAAYFQSYLRSVSRFDIYSISMLLSTIYIAILVTVFVLYFEWELFGILLGYGLGTLLGDLSICIWSKWIHMLNFRACSLYKMKKMLKYSFPLIPNNISWWVMNASDRQIINLFFGDSANGVYAIAHKIPALCSVIVDIFRISWQQEIIEKISLSDRDRYINRILENILTLLFTSCAVLLAGSFILYYFIFDFKYFEAAKYSPILILSTVFMAVSQFAGAIQIALKRTKQNGFSTVAGAVSNIFLHVLLVAELGLYAASVSTLLANVFIAILRIIFVRDIYKMKIKSKVVISSCGCVYFFCISYFNRYMMFNIINLILAILFFAVMNRDIIYEVNRK